jgi:hypothetical protein
VPDYGGYLQFRRSVRVLDVAGPSEPEPDSESDSESGCGGDGTSASGLSIRLKPDPAGRNPTRLVGMGLSGLACPRQVAVALTLGAAASGPGSMQAPPGMPPSRLEGSSRAECRAQE